VSQPLIPAGEQSGLQTRIAATERGFVVRADEKLTAFVGLEYAIKQLIRSRATKFSSSATA
jgi:hypothetical protein